MTSRARQLRRVWAAPVLIAGATLVSLVGALLADGVWDGVAALILFAVVSYAAVLGLNHGR